MTRIIRDIPLSAVPFKRGVCGNCFTELSADNGQCVADTIAAFMELRGRKVMLRCAKEKLQLRGIVELFEQKGVFLQTFFVLRNYF